MMSCDVTLDFKERNAIVAQQWAELNDEERKEWGARAELVCSTSIQVSSNFSNIFN